MGFGILGIWRGLKESVPSSMVLGIVGIVGIVGVKIHVSRLVWGGSVGSGIKIQ